MKNKYPEIIGNCPNCNGEDFQRLDIHVVYCPDCGSESPDFVPNIYNTWQAHNLGYNK